MRNSSADNRGGLHALSTLKINNTWGTTMIKSIFIGSLLCIAVASSAQAQSLSPDGTILIENLTTAAGTWSLGAQWSLGNWYIYLNGQWAGGGIGNELIV